MVCGGTLLCEVDEADLADESDFSSSLVSGCEEERRLVRLDVCGWSSLAMST